MEFAKAIVAAVLGLWLAGGTAAADMPLLAQAYQPGCPPSGYGVASCPNYGTKSEIEAGRNAAAPSPPPAYETTNDCLKAGWGIAQCQGFDAWWKKNESVETIPNPDQHQGCGGFGTSECPPGGGGGGKN